MLDLRCLLPQDNAEEIVTAYSKHKEKCIDHIYKEFSFVIYDKQKNTHFAARDPIGLKPLYYTQHNNRFFFQET